ncbi:hypothetical protein JTE90_021187 [Oedothorax gibbosus]|uniref:Uncharacterized protein n=1 Tax=Oedothorax gibbosus TaxID=931172 RepID=A0AAV6V6N5_9ARAC|nr:hypothetical protein JTE90_021187 [Oedothorax gibbosus]
MPQHRKTTQQISASPIIYRDAHLHPQNPGPNPTVPSPVKSEKTRLKKVTGGVLVRMSYRTTHKLMFADPCYVVIGVNRMLWYKPILADKLRIT